MSKAHISLSFVVLILPLTGAASISKHSRGLLMRVAEEFTKDGVPMVSTHADVGGGHFPFQEAFEDCLGFRPREFTELLTNPSPQVRVLGAQCAISRNYFPPAYYKLRSDSTPILLTKFSGEEKMTVGQLVRQIESDPALLLRDDHGQKVSLVEVEGSPNSGFIVSSIPEYPPDMVRQGITGEVVIDVSVKSGKLGCFVISETHAELAEACLASVATFRFFGKESNDVHLRLKYSFTIDEG